MNIVQCTWIFWQVFMCHSLEIKPQFYERNEEICRKHAKDPYFDTDIVLGKPWRVYYTWNMKFDKKCFDMQFRNATKKTIERIRTDMTDYLQEEPYWETAAFYLFTTTRSIKHEVLLFPDQGPAGRFVAVPNMSSETKTTGKTIPLLKFLIKLIRNGKYLLLMDCHVGGASLSARPDDPPYRADIASVVAALDLENGFHACTAEKHKDEQLHIQ